MGPTDRGSGRGWPNPFWAGRGCYINSSFSLSLPNPFYSSETICFSFRWPIVGFLPSVATLVACSVSSNLLLLSFVLPTSYLLHFHWFFVRIAVGSNEQNIFLGVFSASVEWWWIHGYLILSRRCFLDGGYRVWLHMDLCQILIGGLPGVKERRCLFYFGQLVTSAVFSCFLPWLIL